MTWHDMTWHDMWQGRLTKRLVTSHDRSRMDTFSLSYGNHDQSDIAFYIRNYSHYFVDLFPVHSDVEAASAIANTLEIDILIDLTAHTYNNRLSIAAMKPSPIVINYLGFPGTTACTGFDYSMVDARAVPPEIASSLFTERVIYLPFSYQANSMPLQVSPCIDRTRCLERLRDSAGHGHNHSYTSPSPPTIITTTQPLSQSTTTTMNIDLSTAATASTITAHSRRNHRIHLCSFNSNKKFDVVSWQVWMNILTQLPEAM